MKFWFFCLLFLPLWAKSIPQGEGEFCFFTPPTGWELSDPKALSTQVQIAFFKKSSKGFCPSINLATEKTDVSLQEYLKAVKAIYEQDPANRWRALGKVQTKSGLGQLTEIDTPSEFGPVRILQLILMKDGSAYILTAAALKQEFANYYKEIQTAFRSLTLTSDLFSCIPQSERRGMIKQKQENLLEEIDQRNKDFIQDKRWIKFEETILKECADMGTPWQVLVLKSTQEKLLALSQPE